MNKTKLQIWPSTCFSIFFCKPSFDKTYSKCGFIVVTEFSNFWKYDYLPHWEVHLFYDSMNNSKLFLFRLRNSPCTQHIHPERIIICNCKCRSLIKYPWLMFCHNFLYTVVNGTDAHIFIYAFLKRSLYGYPFETWGWENPGLRPKSLRRMAYAFIGLIG